MVLTAHLAGVVLLKQTVCISPVSTVLFGVVSSRRLVGALQLICSFLGLGSKFSMVELFRSSPF